MQLGNPLVALSESWASAKYKDFADIEYETYDYTNYTRDGNYRLSDLPKIKATRRPEERDMEVLGVFAQTWGSTALGFGGIGGAAMTPAYTVVIMCGREFAVYFGGRFAYKVLNPDPKFMTDLQNQNMVKVSEMGRYLRE